VDVRAARSPVAAGGADPGLGQAQAAQGPGGGLAGPDQALAWEVPDQEHAGTPGLWPSGQTVGSRQV
jgi:hypothetical protein